MRVDMALATGDAISLIGNPLKMSETPVTYAKPPPALGADTATVLTRCLGLTGPDLAALAAAHVIDGEFDP
jgi:crotonobetainyl-CoA:carnitine CoA-transferase CaiB-like acyl-CoA transferase